MSNNDKVCDVSVQTIRRKITIMKISTCRTLNIKVVNENGEELYSGMIEDAPEEIRCMDYTKVDIKNQVIFYV